MTGARVLVVEDDASILAGLELNLSMEGYQVLTAADGEAAVELLKRPELDLDLALLDVMLPRQNGLEVLEVARRLRPDLPVIILSARDTQGDKVEGLDLGADDYVTKPFGLPELLARINATLRRFRRVSGPQAHVIGFGDVSIDTQARTVTRSAVPVELTTRELDLLVYFARSRGRVLTREQILRNVWGDDYEGTDRTVDNFVARLRTKIERDPENPEHLETVRGVGYRFKHDPRAP